MIAIINYRAGNLTSVERALLHLGIECRITDNYDEILAAQRVIFPGVGAAGKAMETISELKLDKAIHAVIDKGTPFMGICLGTQIILSHSEEDGGTPCLNLIEGQVKRFEDQGLKIPHMGWNSITVCHEHPMLEGVDKDAQFYFVHSYYPSPEKEQDSVAKTEYGTSFSSVLAHANIFATQFHPEKSGPQGLRILENFSRWDGKF